MDVFHLFFILFLVNGCFLTSHSQGSTWNQIVYYIIEYFRFYSHDKTIWTVIFFAHGSNIFQTASWFGTCFVIFSLPIGSMYAIYGNIYHQYTPNVSIYTSTMDPMGYIGKFIIPTDFHSIIFQRARPTNRCHGDEFCLDATPGLVNIHKTTEGSSIFNGKTHYFDWAMFNSKLLVYQRVSNLSATYIFDVSWCG